MDLRKLLIRREGGLLPRVKAITRERDLESLDFEEGTRPDVDPGQLRQEVVGDAQTTSGLLGPSTQIEFGTAESGSEQGWYRVTFDEVFTSEPAVVAVAENREGEFAEKNMESPSHSSPIISTESNRPSFADELEEQFKESSRDMGEELYDTIEDQFDRTLPTVATIDLAQPFNDAWDFILRQTYGFGRLENDGEGLLESIFGFLGRTIGNAMEDGFQEKAQELEVTVRDEVDYNVAVLNNTVNDSYEELTGQSTTALNDSQRLLYESLGAPEGALLTPVHIRNVDNNSFEFLGYEGGMKIHYLAAGTGQRGLARIFG